MDPVTLDPTLATLAWFHPAFVALAFLLALVVFNEGLQQRDQRVRRKAAPSGNLKRHVKLGPWAVGLLVAGLVGGLASSVLVRGWKPMGTWHGWFGLGAVALFGTVWFLGRALLRGEKHRAALHGYLALGAVALGVVAVVTGISLLP